MTVQAVCAGLWTGLGSPGASSLGETQPGTHTSSLVGPEGGLRETRENQERLPGGKGILAKALANKREEKSDKVKAE